MGKMIKIYAIVFFIGAIIFVSGCVSPQTTKPSATISSLTPTTDITTQYPPDPSHWIQIDPIRNFQIDPKSGSVRLLFNITGTTNLPVDSLLVVGSNRKMFDLGSDNQVLIWNVVVPVVNSGGSVNTFFYAVNVSTDYLWNPIKPGQYNVEVHHFGVNNSTVFSVFGKDPLPWLWIHINPIEEHQFGDRFNITGTTNVPAGSTISVNGGLTIHPCPFIPPEKQSSYPGSICGSCAPVAFYGNIPVVQGPGNNTWNFPINTTGWCTDEKYDIGVSKREWDNVSSTSAQIQFGAV
jgi:hypothetical protein